jgi:hypothetical protein
MQLLYISCPTSFRPSQFWLENCGILCSKITISQFVAKYRGSSIANVAIFYYQNLLLFCFRFFKKLNQRLFPSLK